MVRLMFVMKSRYTFSLLVYLQLYVFHVNVTFAYHRQRLILSSTTKSHHRKYLSAPTQYYNNCSASYHLERVLNLSNDIEVNPGPGTAEVFNFSDSLFNENTFNSSTSSSLLNSSCSSATISHHSKCNNILSIFFNARSVGNKQTELQSLIDIENPDILAVNESWLDNNITDSEIVDPSFILFRRDRNRHGGGVFIAIKDYLNPIRNPSV